MKTIDIKSLIIGALLTSTIFLGVAATSKDDAGKWDDKQQWVVGEFTPEAVTSKGGGMTGWEPTGHSRHTTRRGTIGFDGKEGPKKAGPWMTTWRKRVK